MQVNAKIGLSFATGLRSILRQDPDVIMIGEIRDRETADIAIHASLTGHLVFSTLHTNDAASAATRLIDMGIEPFLVASSVVGVLAQRLVRKLCPHCREPYPAPAEELAKLGCRTDVLVDTLYRSVGCPQCAETGYRGRTGIFELLLMDQDLRRVIGTKGDAALIKAEAVAKGMVTLQEEGARLVADGVTTTEEVMRMTQHDVEL
jgi:general secretion pathway protein E